MKKYIVFLLVFCVGLNSWAQETSDPTVPETQGTKPVPIDFNVSLETSHLWRGLVINDGMTATGFVHLALDKNQNFTTGVWGGAGFDGTYHEINYYIQYQKNNLSIGVWDLFNTTGITDPEVFNYDKLTTTHIIDLRTSYVFAQSFPLRLEADVLLYTGLADRELDSDNDYKSRYSTYAEVSYPIIENQKVTMNVFMGAAFALDGTSNLYRTDDTKDFGIVNTGFRLAKELSIFEYKLPVSATAMWNPANKIARIKLDINLF
jgi:hypothetical protein